MSRAEYHNLNWCLYNAETEQVIEGLAWEQFRAMVKTLRKDDHEKWYYWNDEMDNWHKLEGILEEALDDSQKRVRIPPLPPSMPNNLDSSGVTRIPVNKDEIDMRTTRRYNRKVPAIIYLGSEQFNSETSNISIGGAKLNSKLPENISTSFQVKLEIKPNPISLEAVVIDNAESGARIKFLPTENLEELRDFLLGVN